MKYFVPKGQALRVFLQDTWTDFRAVDTPITAHFDGGSLIVTQDQDKVLLGSWGPTQFLRAELTK